MRIGHKLQMVLILLAGVLVLSSAANAATILTDNFSNGLNPAWMVDSGTVKVQDGELAFGTEANGAAHLDLGNTAWKTPVKVTLKLREGTAGGNYLFTVGLSNSALGKGYAMPCSPNVGYFGTSGFAGSGTGASLGAGTTGAHLSTDATSQTLELLFDPSADSVTLSQDGVVVFATSNSLNLARVDRLTLDSGGGPQWFVDDVVAEGTLPDPNVKFPPGHEAIQTVYTAGVPHTDQHGRRMMTYDPQRSFFQIGVWGNPIGLVYGVNYDLKILTNAGFNTMWPWYGDLASALAAGKAAGLQVVAMGPRTPAELGKFADDPNLLGNVWYDEPTGAFWGKDMQAQYQAFQTYKATANRLAPDLPVFVNDVPWIQPPATEWWTKWNTAGDVECHDNYPITPACQSIGAIADTVSLAASVNAEKKPVWLIVGAFDGGWVMPTPAQLRACVYAGLIHGATGIIYFTWDTYVSRDGGVIGMSPDPKTAYVPNPQQPGYTHPSPATPLQRIASKAAWGTAAQVNQEISAVVPSLLSPTVSPRDLEYSLLVDGLGRMENPIHCLLKPYPQGGYVLITVNLNDTVLGATYTFPKELKSVERLFEDQPPLTLPAGAKTFTDTYGSFGVHVYHITFN